MSLGGEWGDYANAVPGECGATVLKGAVVQREAIPTTVQSRFRWPVIREGHEYHGWAQWGASVEKMVDAGAGESRCEERKRDRGGTGEARCGNRRGRCWEYAGSPEAGRDIGQTEIGSTMTEHGAMILDRRRRATLIRESKWAATGLHGVCTSWDIRVTRPRLRETA